MFLKNKQNRQTIDKSHKVKKEKEIARSEFLILSEIKGEIITELPGNLRLYECLL